MSDLYLPCVQYVSFVTIVLVAVPTEARQEIKHFFPRAGRKLKAEAVVEQHVFRSKLECATVCASRSFCAGASWGVLEKVCLLTAHNIMDYGIDNSNMFAAANWVTMAEPIYPVALYTGPGGHYELTLEEGKSLCFKLNTVIATTTELLLARSMGYQLCVCGWLEDGTNGFVMQSHYPGCWNTFTIGIHECSGLSDVYCRTV